MVSKKHQLTEKDDIDSNYSNKMRKCCVCGVVSFAEDLNTVDCETSQGDHYTIEVCDSCYKWMGEPC